MAEHQDRASTRSPAQAACAELDTLFTNLDSPAYSPGAEGWPSRRIGDLCDISTGVLHQFLRDDLKLELSQDKTLITHARTGAARFLGYEITVQHNESKISRGRRAVNVGGAGDAEHSVLSRGGERHGRQCWLSVPRAVPKLSLNYRCGCYV